MTVPEKPLAIVYLDNVIVSDLATKKYSVSEVLSACQVDGARFAFTDYSVIEAVNGNDPQRILLRAGLIDDIASIWLPDMLWQRDLAFVRFLTSDDTTKVEPPLFRSFAELLRGDPRWGCVTVPESYSAKQYALSKIRGGHSHVDLKNSFLGLEKVRRELSKPHDPITDSEINWWLALSVLQRYSIQVVDSAAMQLKVLLGHAQLRAMSPAFDVEIHISKFRTSELHKRQASNSVDLFHVTSALPICDFFVTQDVDVLRAIRYVADRTSHRIAKGVSITERTA
jgi:hypothetical protein